MKSQHKWWKRERDTEAGKTTNVGMAEIVFTFWKMLIGFSSTCCQVRESFVLQWRFSFEMSREGRIQSSGNSFVAFFFLRFLLVSDHLLRSKETRNWWWPHSTNPSSTFLFINLLMSFVPIHCGLFPSVGRYLVQIGFVTAIFNICLYIFILLSRISLQPAVKKQIVFHKNKNHKHVRIALRTHFNCKANIRWYNKLNPKLMVNKVMFIVQQPSCKWWAFKFVEIVPEMIFNTKFQLMMSTICVIAEFVNNEITSSPVKTGPEVQWMHLSLVFHSSTVDKAPISSN